MNSLFKPTSYAQGTLQAVGATFVWKLISFVNALLLASYFGATYQTDIYFYLVMLIGFGIAFIQRLNQTILIPEAMFLHSRSPQEARQFLTMWFYIYGILGITCGVLGSLFAVNGWALFSRFNPQELASQQMVLIGGAWWFGLQLVSYYLQTIAEMFKYFATAWLGILNALFPLLCLLAVGKQAGLASMLYGFIAANLFQITVLLILCKKRAGFSFTPARHKLPQRAWHNMASGQSLAILDIVNSLLPLYLMSGLNAGIISALNYCRQFTDSATEIFTARTANITKIQLTENITQLQEERFNQNFMMATRLLVMILAPLALFSYYFAPQIVELFFKRGAFSAQAAHETVTFLRPMLFVMLLSAPGYLQNSAIAACRKIKESFPYALSAACALMALLVLVIPRFGAFTYPYLLGAGLLIGCVLNAFFFRVYLPFITYGQHLWLTLRITALAALALIPTTVLANLLSLGCFLQILVCGIFFVSIYAKLCKLSQEGKQLSQFFRNSL